MNDKIEKEFNQRFKIVSYDKRARFLFDDYEIWLMPFCMALHDNKLEFNFNTKYGTLYPVLFSSEGMLIQKKFEQLFLRIFKDVKTNQNIALYLTDKNKEIREFVQYLLRDTKWKP